MARIRKQGPVEPLTIENPPEALEAPLTAVVGQSHS